MDLKEGSSNVVVMVMPKIDHCLAVHMHSSAVVVFYYGVNKSTGMISIERDMWGSFSYHGVDNLFYRDNYNDRMLVE